MGGVCIEGASKQSALWAIGKWRIALFTSLFSRALPGTIRRPRDAKRVYGNENSVLFLSSRFLPPTHSPSLFTRGMQGNETI